MARVFVSYRRTDGRMAVDWLAERLQGVGVAKDVQAAFHDGGLKGGDDFAAALIEELRQCDLVIAVIGPHWEGRKEHGPARIQDAEDWVVKELATADDLKARVVPVLIDGAQLPVAADVHESIAWLRGRHALRFDPRRPRQGDRRPRSPVADHARAAVASWRSDRAPDGESLGVRRRR